MKKVTFWFSLVVLAVIISSLTPGTAFSSTPITPQAMQQRADVIIIDDMTVFGKLEKPPVIFLHEPHTKALAGKNQSGEKLVCSSCHLMKDGKLSPKFKRVEDFNKTTVMNLYHDECIGCHGEMKKTKEISGPIECGECHTRKAKYSPKRSSMGFDLSLHQRHSKAADDKCEKCHHAYNEEKEELFYAKGEEGTCRYCHKEKTVDNRDSMAIASHMACIGCHITTKAEPEANLPITCSACHDELEQQKIKKTDTVPRIKRNQPDMALLRADDKTLSRQISSGQTNQMHFVPFNHKAHENSNDTCRVCHHNSLKACNSCHTPDGPKRETLDDKPEKSAVALDKAMHQNNSRQSCIGCHNQAKKKQSCAGCHGFFSPIKKMKDDQCIVCHSVDPNTVKPNIDREEENNLAKATFADKKELANTIPESEIPEFVTIKRLENLYDPVKFPHRKVVKAVAAHVQDDKLSGFFHTDETTLCMGCHHNSPASKKPPQCASCHGARWDDSQLGKPGILGAYHQQCMGCHKAMKIEKYMGCTECHKLKAN